LIKEVDELDVEYHEKHQDEEELDPDDDSHPETVRVTNELKEWNALLEQWSKFELIGDDHKLFPHYQIVEIINGST